MCIRKRGKKEEKKRYSRLKNDIDRPGFIDLPFIFHKNPVAALNFSLQKDYNHRFVMDFTGYACIISTVY